MSGLIGNPTSKITHLQPSPIPGESDRARLIPFLFVCLFAAATFFSGLGDYPLFNPDESLYAEPAREMLETGEYITTLLNYVVRFTKPPLVIWAMAASYKVFGVNEFAARFFGAACGLILVAALYWFAERYASRRAAVLACVSLITAPLFVGTAREAITDMPLSLFIGGALMSFFHGYQSKGPWWRWNALGYALIGLAVMTKGPVGLLLPVAVLSAYHLWRRDIFAAWRYYQPLAGLAVIALIAVPWFAVEIYVTKGAYYQEFLVRENFQRFTSVVDHKGAWWYHLAAMAGGMFPWTLFAPQSLFAAFRWLTQDPACKRDLGLRLFCGLWLVVVVAFFSASVSKLLPYTVPAFPALAILIAVYLDQAFSEGRQSAIAVPMFILAVLAGVALYVVPSAVAPLHELPADLPRLLQMVLAAIGLTAVCAAIGACINRSLAAVGVFSLGLAAIFAIFGHAALTILSREWEGPVPWFSQFAALSGQPVVVWHMRKPSVPFYAGRQVVVPDNATKLHAYLQDANQAYIIAKVADLDEFKGESGCRVLLQQGRFALLRQNRKEH